ncbi:MAG: hypothetical protein OJF61_002034 [Rhodanobacteraceae bacterium]|nr:MAG: hypothetical protein OJF61_002034 [Rhodanobacteraceae bacterium]
MKTKNIWACALAAIASFAGAAHAAPPASAQPAAALALFGVAPASDSELSAACGGYDLGNGLMVSFGISRLVYINGGLAASISVNIPDLSHMDATQANALKSLLNGITLIRNGPGNFTDPAAFNGAIGAIVIQNTLDNQRIQALTTFDARVRNLGMFNALNLGNTLQSALINSRGQ